MIIDLVDSPQIDRSNDAKTYFKVKLNGYPFDVLLHRKPNDTRLQFIFCPMRHVLSKYGMAEEHFLPYLKRLSVGESCIVPLNKEVEKEVMDALFEWGLSLKIKRADHQLEIDLKNKLKAHPSFRDLPIKLPTRPSVISCIDE